MLRFDWNSLRTGDTVVVHDPRDKDLVLVGGAVSAVEFRTGKTGLNGVGIRVGTGDAARVVWPSYLAVHRDGNDRPAPCWRCATRK